MFPDELRTKCQNVTLKTFSSVYISVDSPEQDIIAFNIPVIIAKKHQINVQARGETLPISLKACF